MSPAFTVLQGDVSIQVDFADPTFALMVEPSALQYAIFQQLSSRFGLRLVDMRPEVGSGNLADLGLFCWLAQYSTSVRVKAERLEVTCTDSSRLTQAQFVDVTLNSLEALKRWASAPYKTYTLNSNLHGTIEGTSTKDFLLRLTPKLPQNLGPLIGSGVVFYYGPEADRLNSFVTLDQSGLHAGALLLRMHVAWDAQKVPLADMPNIADKYTQTLFAAVGLSVARPGK